MVDKITCNLSIRVLFYTLVNNFDLGVFCYLYRGNSPIYSGPFLPLKNVLECSLQSYDSKTQSFDAPGIKIWCFSVRRKWRLK